MKITGKVVFENIGTGIWGIIDNENNKWEVINLPKSLQKDGKIVSIDVTEEDSFSIYMWGTPVRVIK